MSEAVTSTTLQGSPPSPNKVANDASASPKWPLTPKRPHDVLAQDSDCEDDEDEVPPCPSTEDFADQLLVDLDAYSRRQEEEEEEEEEEEDAAEDWEDSSWRSSQSESPTGADQEPRDPTPPAPRPKAAPSAHSLISPPSKRSSGDWSAEEDAAILDAVGRVGCKWRAVASTLVGRSDDAVRNRWARLLREGRAGNVAPPDGVLKVKGMSASSPHTPSPKRARGPATPRVCWRPEEDATIIRSVAELGTKWPRIAARLPGRTEHSVRNRHQRLVLQARA